MRKSSFQKVKNVVEQKAGKYIISELERVAEMEPKPVKVLSLIKRRVSHLFPEQTERKLSEIVELEIKEKEWAELPECTIAMAKWKHAIPNPKSWFRFYSKLIAKLISKFGDCYAYTCYEQRFEEMRYPRF